MGKRPKKNVVLFLVEGKSERKALEPVIMDLYDQIDETVEIFFPIIFDDEEGERGGDITSLFSVRPNNIETKIYDLFLKNFFDTQKILPKDITEVIQIVDMDGAYLEDDKILVQEEMSEEEHTYYDYDAIIVGNSYKRDKLIDRNDCKRENLNYLVGKEFIRIKQKTVKYSIYYFSSNLDHFLHNDANLAPSEKVSKAEVFANEYIGDSNGFVRRISEDPDSLNDMTYEQSWDFIRERGPNSIQRHSNLNILLTKLEELAGVSED